MTAEVHLEDAVAVLELVALEIPPPKIAEPAVHEKQGGIAFARGFEVDEGTVGGVSLLSHAIIVAKAGAG